jgi:hypothetical protein
MLDRAMAIVFGCIVVMIGVVIGWYTVAGSGIHHHPHGRDRYFGESPLDSPRTMNQWSRGTQSSARRRRRRRRT